MPREEEETLKKMGSINHERKPEKNPGAQGGKNGSPA